jgi:hypothetical protein
VVGFIRIIPPAIIIIIVPGQDLEPHYTPSTYLAFKHQPSLILPITPSVRMIGIPIAFTTKNSDDPKVWNHERDGLKWVFQGWRCIITFIPEREIGSKDYSRDRFPLEHKTDAPHELIINPNGLYWECEYQRQ